MAWIGLVGPEFEENLSLRYIASSLKAAGFDSELLAFNRPSDLPVVGAGLLQSGREPPLLVGLSLAFQWRAQDFLALAMALRQAGYHGHITTGGHFATFSKRYRLREPAAIADEMVALQRTRGIDVFVFHDDNFFVPGHRKNYFDGTPIRSRRPETSGRQRRHRVPAEVA